MLMANGKVLLEWGANLHFSDEVRHDLGER